MCLTETQILTKKDRFRDSEPDLHNYTTKHGNSTQNSFANSALFAHANQY